MFLHRHEWNPVLLILKKDRAMMQDKVYLLSLRKVGSKWSRNKVRVELSSLLLFVIRRVRYFVVFSCTDFMKFSMVRLGILKLVVMIMMNFNR